jgi:guanylate kinase
MEKGLLIVVSAPSGCGKGTILEEILKDDKYYYSVSATTRKPRVGETNGVQYHFLTMEDFQNRIDNGGMLEYAQYCDNYYGTPKKEVEEKLNEGKHVILEIEVQGAMKVKDICPEATFIFITPPSLEELERRLRKRNTESEEVIKQRVAQAEREIPYSKYYDYVIVNDDIKDAIDDFKSVIRACELKVK